MGEQNTWIGTRSFVTGIDLTRAQIGGYSTRSCGGRPMTSGSTPSSQRLPTFAPPPTGPLRPYPKYAWTWPSAQARRPADLARGGRPPHGRRQQGNRPEHLRGLTEATEQPVQRTLGVQSAD